MVSSKEITQFESEEIGDTFNLIFMLIGPSNVYINLFNNKYISTEVWDLAGNKTVDGMTLTACTKELTENFIKPSVFD